MDKEEERRGGRKGGGYGMIVFKPRSEMENE